MENTQTSTYPMINLKPQKRKTFFQHVMEDIQAAQQRDPAARSTLEVALLYSGLHALWYWRIAHWLWQRRVRFVARWLSQLGRAVTGIEIHPGAQIGDHLFIDHGMGVVIGETAEIGNDVTLYHGVTLGGVSLEKGKRHPTLEDRVVVGAGAKILGNIVIGEGSRIGANAVVVKPVPPNSVVVGIPGQVVKKQESHEGMAPDLHHEKLPDALGDCLRQTLARVEALEKQLNVQQGETLHQDADGAWDGTDFSI